MGFRIEKRIQGRIIQIIPPEKLSDYLGDVAVELGNGMYCLNVVHKDVPQPNTWMEALKLNFTKKEYPTDQWVIFTQKSTYKEGELIDLLVRNLEEPVITYWVEDAPKEM